MTTTLEALKRNDPAFHQEGRSRWNALPNILRALETLLEESMTTVETGCGASTVVFAASGSTHTSISPDAREHTLVSEYCSREGIDVANVRFLAASSDVVLPKLYQERILDLAFIDGEHSFPYAIIDWHYISQALKPGGWLLVDDIAIPSISPLYKFMKAEQHWELVSTPGRRAALFRMLGEPPPTNFTNQVFNRRMDYSFVPPFTRAYLHARDFEEGLRKLAAMKFPRLHKAYREHF